MTYKDQVDQINCAVAMLKASKGYNQVSPENIYRIKKSFLKDIEKDLRKDIESHKNTIDGFPIIGAIYWTLELLNTWQEIIKDDFKNGNV